ncbi:hypothetical protein ACWD0G_21615 [Streptomyces goshikiensis]
MLQLLLADRRERVEQQRAGPAEEVLQDGSGVPLGQPFEFARHPPVEGAAGDGDVREAVVPGLLGQRPAGLGEVGTEYLDRGPAAFLNQAAE